MSEHEAPPWNSEGWFGSDGVGRVEEQYKSDSRIVAERVLQWFCGCPLQLLLSSKAPRSTRQQSQPQETQSDSKVFAPPSRVTSGHSSVLMRCLSSLAGQHP